MGYHDMWVCAGIFGATSDDTLTVWTRSSASLPPGNRTQAPDTEVNVPVGSGIWSKLT